MSDRSVIGEQSTAPVTDVNASPQDANDEDMPSAKLTRRHWLLFGLFVFCAVAFLYFFLPRIEGLGDTWHRVRTGDTWWLAVGVALECLAWGGYILLFRTVFIRGQSRIDWRESLQITLASLAATRLFNAAGAGGIALTAWALRRSGMEPRIVACRMVAFLVILYFVYMLSIIVFGIGLYTGLFNGGGSFAITVAPAIVAVLLIGIFFAISLVPSDFERLVARWTRGHRRLRLARWARRLATVPASISSGVRTAIDVIRERPLGMVGAIGWWFFDIGVLWASFHAFGHNPPDFSIIVMSYFLGMVFNLLPIPGGIGGVDGGLIGAFIAFGVNSGYAVVAVLAYRAIAFWLPTIPGAIAYLALRRTVNRWKDEGREARAAVTAGGGTIQSEV